MPKNHFLGEILLQKRMEIDAYKIILKESDLQHMIRGAAPPRSLAQALTRANSIAVIAEMKKASPSAGIIRERYHPAELAQRYAAAGADAVSVLTDETFFLGSVQHLVHVRPLLQVPVLRKDFILEPYQVLQSRAFGADALLLIAAILSPVQLVELLAVTRELGMQALVEVHTAREMETALQAGAEIIGINNRDLKTFRVDLAVFEELAPLARGRAVLVAESGLQSPADVQRMAAAGADAVLVGSHFMRQADPGAALAAFMRNGRQRASKNGVQRREAKR